MSHTATLPWAALPELLRLAAGGLLLGALAWLSACDGAAPYQRRDGVWTFDDRPLGDGHITRLTVLNARFAKTGSQVFYRQAVIEGADAASFEALDEHHGRDRHRVVHGDTYRVSQDYFSTLRIRLRVLEGADSASFRLLGQSYARDDRRVYHEGDPVDVRDPASFMPLDQGFARDRFVGYWLHTPVPGSDGPSFVVLGPHNARDTTHVYHADLDYRQPGPAGARIQRIRGARADSFRVLEGGYAADAAQVYWQGQVIVDANAASFQTLPAGSGDADAHDDRRSYRRGAPLSP